MTDYTELKRLAEAVRDEESDWQPTQKTCDYFQALRQPGVVLFLIAELDQLKTENERLNAEMECPFRLARHSKRLVEKLRAENEALRKVLTSSHEFILNDARTRRMCDEAGWVSSLFPKRVGILAAIDAVMSKEKVQ